VFCIPIFLFFNIPKNISTLFLKKSQLLSVQQKSSLDGKEELEGRYFSQIIPRLFNENIFRASF